MKCTNLDFAPINLNDYCQLFLAENSYCYFTKLNSLHRRVLVAFLCIAISSGVLAQGNQVVISRIGKTENQVERQHLVPNGCKLTLVALVYEKLKGLLEDADDTAIEISFTKKVDGENFEMTRKVPFEKVKFIRFKPVSHFTNGKGILLIGASLIYPAFVAISPYFLVGWAPAAALEIYLITTGVNLLSQGKKFKMKRWKLSSIDFVQINP